MSEPYETYDDDFTFRVRGHSSRSPERQGSHGGDLRRCSMTGLTREQIEEWLRLAEGEAESAAEVMERGESRKDHSVAALCRALLDTQDRLTLALAEVRAGRKLVDADGCAEVAAVYNWNAETDTIQKRYAAARAALGEEV